ncbi:MAG: glutamate 5-kinase, partial [Candidatus Omnitrophica bacterium]|nr:glutamate 5-kinase [Candidatus Omnitrophota bacterium]
AKTALQLGGKSLLLPGIVSWQGHFKKNDIVVIKDRNNHEIARGKSNYSLSELNNIQDKKGQLEAVHCDNLVLAER